MTCYEDVNKYIRECHQNFLNPEVNSDQIDSHGDMEIIFQDQRRLKYNKILFVTMIEPSLVTAMENIRYEDIIVIYPQQTVNDVFDKFEDFFRSRSLSPEPDADACETITSSVQQSQFYSEAHMDDSGIDTETFICEFCAMKYASQKQLSAHYFAKHSSKSLHQCTKCSKKFLHKYLLTKHVKQVHQESSSHSCPVCFKNYKSQSALKVHLKLHLPEEGKDPKFVCPSCSKICSSKFNLERHKKVHDPTDSEKSWRCKNCPRVFTRLDSYQRHCNKSCL